MVAKAELTKVDPNGPVETQRRDTLRAIARTLEARKTKAVQHKTQVEFRMQQDNDQYWGLGSGPTTKADVAAGYSGNRNTNHTPIDNKTRSMTRIAAARIGDMLFPTNAPNWALRPTPDPDIDESLVRAEYQNDLQANPPQPGPNGEPGQPPPPNYEALAMQVANRACRKMSRKVSDCLTQSAYSELGRAAILDACKLGTGIIKGPYMKRVVRKSYNTVDDVAVLRPSITVTPAVARVDPWMFYPQHARCIEEAEYAFELHLYTATKIRQMVMTHGFYPEQVNDLLAMPPDRGAVDHMLRRRSTLLSEADGYEDAYALWEYHGPMDRTELESLGIDVPPDDNLTAYTAEIWFAQGNAVRVSLSPLEADTTLGYHVFNYEEDEGSVFGFGVPFIMRDDQMVIDMMWAAMIHNASVSAGPQVAIKKGLVTPADNSYLISGPKLWYLNDEDMPIQEAIQTMVIPSTINTNMPLYTQAKENADANTNLPMMLGDGQAAQVQGGQGGQAGILNAQNIVQRQAAHNWDDHITARLIGRIYDWFMQHDPDPSIKGDYDVEVRGASYLLIKDQQAQHAQLLVQMTSQDQELAALVKKDELYRTYVGFMDIPSSQLLRTPEEVAVWQSQQQPDPMQTAEVGKVNAATDKLTAEAEQIRSEIAGGQPQIDPETGQPIPQAPEPMTEKEANMIELEWAKLQQAEADRDSSINIELIRRDTTMMKVAAASDMELSKIQAQAQDSESARMFKAGIEQANRAREDYFKAAELRLKAHELRLNTIDSRRGFDSGA